MTQDRQTGRTTRQLETAHLGSVFVWCSEQPFYPRDLAAQLGRRDIVVATPKTWFRKWVGTKKSVVFDHALDLSNLESDEYAYYSRFSEKALAAST